MSQLQEIIQLQWNFSQLMIEKILQSPSDEISNSLQSILLKFQQQLIILETQSQPEKEIIESKESSSFQINQISLQNFSIKPEVKSKKNARKQNEISNSEGDHVKKQRKIEKITDNISEEELLQKIQEYNNQRKKKILCSESKQIEEQCQDQMTEESLTEICPNIEQEEERGKEEEGDEQSGKEEVGDQKQKKMLKKKNCSVSQNNTIQNKYPSITDKEANYLKENGFSVKFDKNITQKHHLSWKDKNLNQNIWARYQNDGYLSQMKGARQYVKEFFNRERKFMNLISFNEDLNKEQKNYLKMYCEAVLKFIQFRKMNIVEFIYQDTNSVIAQNDNETMIIIWKFSAKKQHLIINEEDNGMLKEKILEDQILYSDERKLSYLILPLLSIPLSLVEYSSDQILSASEEKYKTKQFQQKMIWRTKQNGSKNFKIDDYFNVQNIGQFLIRNLINQCKINPSSQLASHFNNLENAALYRDSANESPESFYCIHNAIQQTD